MPELLKARVKPRPKPRPIDKELLSKLFGPNLLRTPETFIPHYDLKQALAALDVVTSTKIPGGNSFEFWQAKIEYVDDDADNMRVTISHPSGTPTYTADWTSNHTMPVIVMCAILRWAGLTEQQLEDLIPDDLPETHASIFIPLLPKWALKMLGLIP